MRVLLLPRPWKPEQNKIYRFIVEFLTLLKHQILLQMVAPRRRLLRRQVDHEEFEAVVVLAVGRVQMVDEQTVVGQIFKHQIACEI